MEPADAVSAWRAFATRTAVSYRNEVRTWAQHISGGRGYNDEEELVQPLVFRRFAEELLDFEIGMTLAAEQADRNMRPDFTPADAVTHPFVFETKSTRYGVALQGPELEAQVLRYLTAGRVKIRKVVLTNLVGLRVFELGERGELQEAGPTIDLTALLAGEVEQAAGLGSARALARFLDEFRRRELSREEKLQQARRAQQWEPLVEVTDAAWISARLDRVVQDLTHEVRDQVSRGALSDEARTGDSERSLIESELEGLEWRIADSRERPVRALEEYSTAGANTAAGKALAQYEAHVAYFCATRLLLVRVFEDLGLLDPMLYDGGLDEWLGRLDAVSEVVDHSFLKARESYPSLFDQRNAYTWFRPSSDALIDIIYELANTYLGKIESDVLGSVYERLLERVDRKLLGQYYTPRDVIRLIWDLVDDDELVSQAEAEGRSVRVLDVASGSGGFLVEAARRFRERLQAQREQGAAIDSRTWVRDVSRGLTGVELQRFPAYLAELNLLIQLALAVAGSREGGAPTAIPPVGVICHDTLATHNPVALFEEGAPDLAEARGQFHDPVREQRFRDLCDPAVNETWFDAAVGNPPYVGETAGGRMIARTREEFPYWNTYYALHLDYLYWFLILGISKLREGGRFGFITSEYWLRATGAARLRAFLAQHCRIDRLVVFRDMRLFPDAPGHHSLIVVGRRVVAPGDLPADAPPAPDHLPTVHILKPAAARERRLRQAAFDAIREGRSTVAVSSFRATVAPNALIGQSWAEVILTREQIRRRRRIRALGEPAIAGSEEGVLTGANSLRAKDRRLLSQQTLAQLDANDDRGIFVLTQGEVGRLGELNAAEREAVKPIVNTQDVFPYACIPRRDGKAMLYLPEPEPPDVEDGGEGAVEFDLQRDMPSLARHLERFRPVLEDKVRRYGERRPWWTIHRGRPGIRAAEGTHERWAGYALTARWGGGGRLLVGLAPRGVAAESGLHALLPSDGVDAAYLVAMLNSTPVQALADALAPGQLRTEDVFGLGLPILEAEPVDAIRASGLALAEMVRELVEQQAPRWPRLADELRADLRLADFAPGAWRPPPGPPTRWGRLDAVGWIAEVAPGRIRRQAVREVETSETLFGLEVVATGNAGAALNFRLEDNDAELAQALAAFSRGAAAAGSELGELPGLLVPTDPSELASMYRDDLADLDDALARYRDERAIVDSALDAVLG